MACPLKHGFDRLSLRYLRELENDVKPKGPHAHLSYEPKTPFSLHILLSTDNINTSTPQHIPTPPTPEDHRGAPAETVLRSPQPYFTPHPYNHTHQQPLKT